MGQILISTPIPKFHKCLNRNQWYDIADDVAKVLLKESYFLSQEQVDFTKIKNTEILIQRSYALGDLIQLIPVVRHLKKSHNLKISLLTAQQYVDFMGEFNVFENIYNTIPKNKFEHFFILDGILEDDHSLINDERLMHRVKIYERFFGITLDTYRWEM